MDDTDLIRELAKAAQALAACDRHLAAAAQANAALHMSDRVIPNPLAAHVALTLENVRRIVDAHESTICQACGEDFSPFCNCPNKHDSAGRAASSETA